MSTLPPDIQHELLVNVSAGVALAAKDKNVPVTLQQCMEFAGEAINTLEVVTLYGLLKLDNAAVRTMSSKINAMLDLYAAATVICLMREIAGLARLAPDEFSARLRAWAASTGANEPGARRLVWPEPIDAVTEYFKSRSSGPVAVTMPGRASVAYLVDKNSSRRWPLPEGQAKLSDTEPSPSLYLLAKAAGLSASV